MSERFLKYRSLSIEGFSPRFFPNTNNMEVNQTKTATQFHSHFSDGLRENAATAHVHMLVLDQFLIGKQNVLIEGGTIFNHIDGCAKQYLCATALYLISIFCAKKCFCVDREIGAPINGKYLVGGLNACYKQYMKRYMKHINQTHEGDKGRYIKPCLIYLKNSLTF